MLHDCSFTHHVKHKVAGKPADNAEEVTAGGTRMHEKDIGRPGGRPRKTVGRRVGDAKVKPDESYLVRTGRVRSQWAKTMLPKVGERPTGGARQLIWKQ